MQNIILIGFMGSGKDSVGQAIARRRGLCFFSTDRMIELMENRSISSIFQENGEAYFRRLEKRVLNSIRGLQNIVLATGGGIVKDERNRKLLCRIGKVIHLDVSADTVKKRLSGDDTRPLFNPDAVDELMKERAELYRFADIKIHTDEQSPEEIAINILGQLEFEDRQSISIGEKRVSVETAGGKYDVVIGSNILESLLKQVKRIPRRCAIVTNPLVGTLLLDRVQDIFKAGNIDVLPIVIPDGERYKSLQTVSKIYDVLLEKQFDRGDMIIGLGGGVITDIAGFVAATLKRGCRLVNIPTTLLAQVDASVGGKTGVNHKAGKNLIGSFYQPELVLADIELLKTLPQCEYLNGLAEVIKTALIRDEKLVEFLESNVLSVLSRNTIDLQKIVARCIEIKRDIVQADEKETSGMRSLLNFGHTIGHTIEAGTHYRGVKHGEAVAIGMVQEARVGKLSDHLSQLEIDRITSLIKSYHLSTEIPAKLKNNSIRRYLSQDKKITGGMVKLPVLTGIGKSKIKELEWQHFVSYMDQI